jgi:hypothetical protein
MLEQCPRVSRILGDNQVHRSQRLDGAKSHIAKVSYWRRDNVKLTGRLGAGR